MDAEEHARQSQLNVPMYSFRGSLKRGKRERLSTWLRRMATACVRGDTEAEQAVARAMLEVAQAILDQK
jgi:hypothetical protein